MIRYCEYAEHIIDIGKDGFCYGLIDRRRGIKTDISVCARHMVEYYRIYYPDSKIAEHIYQSNWPPKDTA